MNFEIIPTPYFQRRVKELTKKHRSLKQDLEGLIGSLIENPYQGVELSPGIRKIRLSITSKGKGKSGGDRVITYTIALSEVAGEIYLLNIYDKSVNSTVGITEIKKLIKDLGLE